MAQRKASSLNGTTKSNGNGATPAPGSADTTAKFQSLSVHGALNGQNVFVTGGTGFVGKCIVEKILRSTPNVNRIFVLIRSRKGASASERLQTEILESPCFDRLRAERPDFDAFVRSKLVAVAGELTQEGIGLTTEQVAGLTSSVNIIIHSAAIVDFNERLDRAVELNVRGTLRLLELAKQCKNIRAFVHLSTCYVNANREGWVDEKMYPLGFEPTEMMRRIEKLNVSELERISVTRLLGDWPNTYTFTKAMAENLLLTNRGRVPLVILRPSIITPAAAEPVPGWVDVVSAAGAIVLSTALGVLRVLPLHTDVIGDMVPVDYVVNAILLAVPAILDEDRFFVCQVSSSTDHPCTWGTLAHFTLKDFEHFHSNQALQKPSIRLIRSPQWYQIQFFLRYSIPASFMSYLSLLGGEKLKLKADQLNKLVWRVRVLTESFRHFTEREWLFDNRTTRALGLALVQEERAQYPLVIPSPGMDWPEYIRIFVYGLNRFILKEDMVPMEMGRRSHQMDLVTSDSPVPGNVLKRVFSDIDWALSSVQERPNYPIGRPIPAMHAIVLQSTEVQDVIKSLASSRQIPAAQVEAEARAILQKMCGTEDLRVISSLGWLMRKIWRKIYKHIEVDSAAVELVRQAAAKGPIVFIPTHRSYVDFLVISYVCLAAKLPIPYIAAGEDFLGILFVRWLFRNSGAFFIRRTFSGDALYSILFSKYVEQLLLDGQSLEFFIEGTRSRSGKMLHPKMGLLSVVTQVFLEKKIEDLTILPVAISYEKTMEGNVYSNELSGERKIRESLQSLLNSRHVLNVNFGRITLKFAQPLSLREYTENHIQEESRSVIPPSRPLPWLAGQSSKTLVSTPASAGTQAPKYDPFTNKEDRVRYNQVLAYRLVHDLNYGAQCMPTHLVATLVLMYRQGITRSLLVSKVDWLRQEVIARGGEVIGVEREHRAELVKNALMHLDGLVIERRQDVIEPKISSRLEYNNMLALGHYRNKIVHLFFREGIWACAMYGLMNESKSTSHHSVRKALLLEHVVFLYELLRLEFVIKANPDELEDFESSFREMVKNGIFQEVSDGFVDIAPSGEVHFSFLCALFWPFIDSYYAATMVLFTLQPDRKVSEETLIQRAQWLATTLYHESMLCFYESCSKETLNNAFLLLQSWKVIVLTRDRNARAIAPRKFLKTSGAPPKPPIVVSLLPPYHEEGPLTELLKRIGCMRKPPPVQKEAHIGGVRRSLIADIPILAKL